MPRVSIVTREELENIASNKGIKVTNNISDDDLIKANVRHDNKQKVHKIRRKF